MAAPGTFGGWLAGLLLVCAILLLLSGFMFSGARWMRPVAYVFAAIMIVNALGHTAGTIAGRTFASVPLPRPMPGFWSSPFLLASSLYMLFCLRLTAVPGVFPGPPDSA